MILIAPSLDKANHGGIERVSRQVIAIFDGLRAPCDRMLVSNDMGASEGCVKNYRRRYVAMLLDALRMPLDGLEGPILCMHAGLSPVARILAWRLKKPYSVFLHGIEVWRDLPLRTVWGLSGASLLIANSRYTLSTFREWHPRFSGKPGEVVHLGVSGSFEGLEEKRPAGFPDGGRFVLSVGRLSLEDDYKGHRTLIESILLLRKIHTDLFLVMAGGGNAAGFLKKFAGDGSDPRAVVFAGTVTDSELLWLYRHCVVFAMLSEGEGFGLVHLEAMAQAKPCLATHADAAAEIVEDGVSGRLVPPRDPVAAAAAIEEMLKDASALRAMGECGQRRVSERFMEKHFASRLRGVLSS